MTTAAVTLAHRIAQHQLDEHRKTFGGDLAAYAGHVHRVIGLIGMQVDFEEEDADLVGIASFCHDAGIWFDDTWDYLDPSIGLARELLADRAPDRIELATAMIGEHHRLRRARHDHPLVEAMRLADRYDVSFGNAPGPGLTKAGYRALVETYPQAGLRRCLGRAFPHGMRHQPWRPMPMVKL